MDLKTYISALNGQQLQDFSVRCNTTPGHMKQVAGGFRRAGEALAINIERESGRTILCEDMRPDVDWAFLRATKQHS